MAGLATQEVRGTVMLSKPCDVIVNTRPLLVDIETGCRLIGIGRSKLCEMLASGEIKSIKEGTRRLIPLAAIEDWIDRKLAEPLS